MYACKTADTALVTIHAVHGMSFTFQLKLVLIYGFRRAEKLSLPIQLYLPQSVASNATVNEKRKI